MEITTTKNHKLYVIAVSDLGIHLTDEESKLFFLVQPEIELVIREFSSGLSGWGDIMEQDLDYINKTADVIMNKENSVYEKEYEVYFDSLKEGDEVLSLKEFIECLSSKKVDAEK